MIDTYNKSQKGIIVRGAFQGNEEDLYLKLNSQENLPDLVLIPVHYVRALQQNKIIVDISAPVLNKLMGDIPQKYWESVLLDGDIYGIPFSFNSNLLFVNQHILRISGTWREPDPATWDEIFTLARKIRDYTSGKWSIFIPMETLSHFISFVQSFSGMPLFEQQRLVVNSEDAIRAMSTLQEFVYTHDFMPPKITMSEGEQIFLSGKLGIMMAPSSMLVRTQTNLPYNLTVWNLPTADTVNPIITGICFVLTQSAGKKQREIFKFVEYLAEFENAIKWHTHTGSPAILTSAKNSLDLLIFYEENPNYMTPIIEIEKGTIFTPRFDYFTFNKIMKSALERIMLGGEDPRTILNSVQTELDSLNLD
jgi:sn-glycerol 3-phosphate transport system substrate-binding protein